MVQLLNFCDLTTHRLKCLARQHPDLIRKEKQCTPSIRFKIHRLPYEPHLTASYGSLQPKLFTQDLSRDERLET